MELTRFIQLLESERGNVKTLLQEQETPYGGYATVDKQKATVTLNIKVDFENQMGNYPELRLWKGTVFKKNATGNLVTTNQNYRLVDDITGSEKGNGQGATITYYCKTKNLDVSGRKDQWKKYNLFFNENWPKVEQAFQDVCKIPAPQPPLQAQYPTSYCDELKRRQQTPITANAGDIQTFLKGMGHNITVDYAFGNGTATAVGTFMYGAAAGINTVKLLWEKMKASNMDVGATPGFGLKMAQALATYLNGVIPKLISTKCVKPK